MKNPNTTISFIFLFFIALAIFIKKMLQKLVKRHNTPHNVSEDSWSAVISSFTPRARVAYPKCSMATVKWKALNIKIAPGLELRQNLAES